MPTLGPIMASSLIPATQESTWKLTQLYSNNLDIYAHSREIPVKKIGFYS